MATSTPKPVGSTSQPAAPLATLSKTEKMEKKQKKGKGGGESGYPLEIQPRPEFIDHRIKLFEQLKAEYDQQLESKPRLEITVTLPDGSERKGTSWETSPMDLAKQISKSLSEKVLIAKVDGELYDLDRPLETSCKLELLDFEHKEGKKVFWHSSAHVLGEASERHYGCHLCLGPPTEDGFFYEMGMGEHQDRAVSNTDYPALEKVAESAIKEKQKFERLVVRREDLERMFEYNPYKLHLIRSKVPPNTSTTVYRCGPMIDLCVGPHIPHTGLIKSFAVLKNSASYFLGSVEGAREFERGLEGEGGLKEGKEGEGGKEGLGKDGREEEGKDGREEGKEGSGKGNLQRIYGVSFPDKKGMVEYKEFLKEAQRRDHRKIGKEQELWFFSDMSPGAAFWLPNGTRIYNKLMELMRSEYTKRNYQEVISPNMYHSKLWETSGHWQNYKEDMFTLDVGGGVGADSQTEPNSHSHSHPSDSSPGSSPGSGEKEKPEIWALKPMNCPGHCLIFDSRDRSYKELPIRMAEFGIIHRNEASGALSGLTRVRRFVQDDTHVFCMPSQLEDEISALFDFMQHIYGIFGFEFSLELSTRPDNYLGDIKTWDVAEEQLTKALNTHYPHNWSINPGDGAFYGPKIDITIRDALRRSFQCATIQLDFQLPERFGLKYRAAEEKDGEVSRPVIIHRAILGSLERFVAIMTEHFAGKWPFWISPRQVVVIPVAAPYKEYATEIASRLNSLNLYADVDNSDNTLPKKIRNGEIAQYNFILVVGEAELKARAVNVRNRDDIGSKMRKDEMIPLEGTDGIVEKLLELNRSKRLDNRFV